MKEQQLINDFLRDPQVRNFLSLADDINIFSILCIDETRHSNMLGWLLNPRGSHLYGDYFLKALLYRAYTSIESDKKFKSNIKEWNYAEIEFESFTNAVVTQECMLDKNNRIDYIIHDYDNDMEIFIENKTDSKFNDIQLDKYVKAANNRTTSAKYKYYIFLHCFESEAEKAMNPWIGLTYDWLIDAIRDRPVESTNAGIGYLLNSYADWLDDIYTFPSPESYEESAAAINEKHNAFLSSLRPKVTGVKDFTTKLDDDMVLLYARHTDKFDYLFSYSYWEHLAKGFKDTLTEYTIDYSAGQNWLTLHNDGWYEHYNRDDEFCIWVTLQEQAPVDGQGNRKHYQVTLRASFEDLKEFAAKKLQKSFSETLRVRQIAKYNFSIPPSKSPQQLQTSLLREAIPIIREIYNLVDKAIN